MAEQGQPQTRGWWYLPGWLKPGWLTSAVGALATLAFVLDLIALPAALVIAVVAIAIDVGIWLHLHDPRDTPEPVDETVELPVQTFGQGDVTVEPRPDTADTS